MTPKAIQQRLLAFGEVEGALDYLRSAVSVAGRVPDGAPDAALVQSVGIIGAGTMGRGIALAFVAAGRDVVLIDPVAHALDAARAHIEHHIQRQVSRRGLTTRDATAQMSRLHSSQDMNDLFAVDLVIEAVPETSELKQQVLRQSCDICGPLTIFATNTSTLDIDVIAVGSGALDRVIGMHFLIPAQSNKLLELIPSKDTDPWILALMQALALDIGKHSVVAGNCDGFIGNRLFDRYHQEAMYLLEEGATPAQVDQALESWGMKIGPFRALDLIGNDIPWGVRKRRAAERPDIVQPRIGDALCDAGLFGRKTGRGWYRYDADTPHGCAHDGVGDLLAEVSRDLGLTRRDIATDEIVARCVLALAQEAWAVLGDGMAMRASDIDMAFVTGYGFPPDRGGPLEFTRAFGIDDVLSVILEFENRTSRGDTVWRLSDRARQIALDLAAIPEPMCA